MARPPFGNSIHSDRLSPPAGTGRGPHHAVPGRGAHCRLLPQCRCSLRGPSRSCDRDARSSSELLEHQQQIPAGECDAALRRREMRSRQMDEDRAAGAAHSWPRVVVDNDDHVIDAVAAPKFLCAGGIGVADMPVIVAVPDGVAPSIVGPQRPGRQPRPRPLRSIGPEEHQHRPPNTAGSGTIPFTLGVRSAAPSERARQAQRPHTQPAARRRTRAGKNLQGTTIAKRCSGVISPIRTRDCHLCLDTCLKCATSDMLRPRNWPMGSPTS
jgi:hypothetical protein